MKHYRLNQIAMAVLLALLLFFGTRTIVNIAYEEHEPETPGMEVATGEAEKPKEAEAAGEAPAEGGSEVAILLGSADPGRGESAAASCKICHSFEKGQPSPMGPPLHGVIGRDMASVEGFNYSPALKGIEGDWDYESLDAMIHAPQTFAPGTTMAFPGVPDAQQRADVIIFLHTRHDNPPPLPEVGAAAPAAEETAPAEPAEEAAPAEMEEPAAPAEPAEEAAPAEMEEPAAPEEPAPEGAAPAEPMEPAVSEEVMEEIIVNPPTVSEDAPSEPSMGEPPSPSQPQPVYPDEAADDMSESMEGSESPSMGEPPSPSQPQPVYPDGAPDSE